VLADTVLLPVCDAGAPAAAIAVAGGLSWTALAYLAAVSGVLRLSGAQRLRICPRWSEELPWLAFAVAVPAVLVRSWVLVAAAAAGLAAGRLACSAGVRAARRHRLLAEPAVIAGTGALGREIARILQAHPGYGLVPVGFADRLPPGTASGLPLLGAPEDLPAIVERYGVRHVLVCFPAATDAELAVVLRAVRVRVSVVPRLYELGTTVPARYRDEIHAIPLTVLSPAPAGRLAKRLFDVVAGGLLFAAVAPLLGVLMTALLVRHGRPVLFRQVRLSRDGRPVTIVKLRTLDDPAPDTSWAVREETCGRLRRLLRATHFDELPQLWCVLRGSLSLVGPRPERPYFAARFARTVPGYDQRHRVPAGVTGWAQVHGLHGDTSIAQRVRFDNAYIEHRSCWTDLVILARTLGTPLSGLRRSRRSEGERP
jgi:lipopolysaccharide/colanic/teichoic acid biosynthesis glycosyltransferase